MTLRDAPVQPPQSLSLSPLLLLTKTAIPRLPPTSVPRPRLLARLDQGTQRKLTLIAAPAGYGKTMLLIEWLGQRSSQTAWLSLDEGDDDPKRFWAYVIAALQTVQASVGAEATVLLRSLQPFPVEAIVDSLINDLALLTKDVVLALDDYHVVTAATVHRSLAYLLTHMPQHLQVAITSRADPPLPISRLRVRGQLVEVRAADLSFTQAEAAVFLREVMSVSLTDTQIAALETRTEGWIASLHLAALALQHHADADQFVAQFTGSHHYVVDYLAEEVLQRQPESVQRFLLDSAVLDRLAAPLCDAVGERNDSQDVLEALERQVLVIPLDAERRWYRYHHLFATFLRHHLQQRAGAHVQVLHRRASAWYAAHGQFTDAVGHALAAQDWDGAAALLTQIADDMFLRGEIAPLQRWLNALPAALFGTWPQLAIVKAWTLTFTDDVAGVEPQLQIVEQAITAARQHEETAVLHDIPALQGQVAAVRGFVALRHNNLEQAGSLLQQALDRVPDTAPLLRGLVATTLVHIQRARGDVQAAQQARMAMQKIGESSNDVQAWLVQVGMLMEQGHLRDAAQIYRRIIQDAHAHGPDAASPVGPELAIRGLSDILYEWNDLDGAINLLLSDGKHGTQRNRYGIHVTNVLRLARASLAQGDQQAAQGWLQQATTLTYHDQAAGSQLLVHAMQARLALHMGEMAMAERWAQHSDLDLVQPVFPHRDVEYFTLARIWLAQGKVEPVRQLLERCQQVTDAAGQQPVMIELLLLQSLAFRMHGDTSAARAALAHAVKLAEPEAYIRSFVDEGAPMQALLVDLRRTHPADDSITAYLDELIAAFGGTLELPHEAKVEPRTGARPQPLIEPLTERELAVLQCMARGLGNSEIADELIVAVSTVRTHIKNIYGKLAVRNRVEAVTYAQKLALLAA